MLENQDVTTDMDTDISGEASRGRHKSRWIHVVLDFERDCTLVQRHSSKYQTYCAFCDKSTKVGTYVE